MRFKRWERSLVIKAVMIILIVLAMLAANATKVCIIDSGVRPNVKATMCPTGSYDFVNDNSSWGNDELNHGTRVAETIASYAGNDYCIISYSVFSGHTTLDNIIKALDKAKNSCDVINLSLNSSEIFNIKEYTALYYISKRVKIFIAAGNKGKNLDKELLYPVGYKFINWTIVGAKNNLSNYGSIVNQIEDICYNSFCGTSASVAIATGKYVKGLK